jgi:hypothetical protein
VIALDVYPRTHRMPVTPKDIDMSVKTAMRRVNRATDDVRSWLYLAKFETRCHLYARTA